MLSLLSIVAASLVAPEGHGEAPIAVRDTLQTVTVVADKGVVVSRKDIVTIQKGAEISEIINSIPSLSLSDYGSAAGLKTVSLRGLGAANTSIYLDGVRVGNVQSGQADLGFIDPSDFLSMTVDYAQNSLSFNTICPTFAAGKRCNAGVRFMGGPWGSYHPSALMEYKITHRLSARAKLSRYSTRGDFPYQNTEGETHRRVNNDLAQWRAGLDFFGQLKGGDWHAKAYFNDAKRGTPGSTTWPDSTSRQNDRNGLVQFKMNRRHSPLYDINVTAKIAFDNLDYVYTYERYLYNQRELQVNTSHIFHIHDRWKVSAAAGIHWDGLGSTLDEAEYYSASRTSLQGAVASSFDFKRLCIHLALLYNGWFDDGNATEHAEVAKRNSFSPSMDFRLNIFDGLDVVGFARRAYRVPTFNDLYYPGMGSTDLKPEDAWLTDIGVEYSKQITDTYGITAKLNGFHYSLTNKITSMPDPADPTGWTWLMYNIGKVHDNGLDASFSFNKTGGHFHYHFTIRYAYQSAIDKTPDGTHYGKQIPYVARHTTAAIANLDYKGWKANLNYTLRSGRNDTSGELPSWNTLDLSLSRNLDIRVAQLTVFLKAANLFNERYEIVRYYPVPGISFTGGIELYMK